MTSNMPSNLELKTTVGGTLLSITAIPSSATILTTIILAAIGAITSFFVSVILKKLWYKYNPKNK